MYIDKEKWETLKESFQKLYNDYDNFSDATKDLLDNVDINIELVEKNMSDKIYVITNNAVVDDEVFYNILGITPNLEEAKKMLNQNIKDIKCDADFDDLDAIELTDDIDTSSLDEVWVYDQDEYGFNLYLNCNYNSNNYSSHIEQYDLSKSKENEKELDV